MLLFCTPALFPGRRGFPGFATGKAAVLLLCVSFACATGRSAWASTFQINVTAANLTPNTNYGLSFELQNGLLDNPLQASVSNFSSLGGTLSGGGSTIANNVNPATGSLNSVLLLATTDLLDTSDYVQQFTSSTGSAVMAFTLNLSSSFPQSDLTIPDFFRFTFLDSSGTPALTSAPDNNSLVYAAFDTTSPFVQTFRTSDPTGPQVAAQIQPSAAPEPGTFVLSLPFGASGALWLHYRRKRTPAHS